MFPILQGQSYFELALYIFSMRNISRNDPVDEILGQKLATYFLDISNCGDFPFVLFIKEYIKTKIHEGIINPYIPGMDRKRYKRR